MREQSVQVPRLVGWTGHPTEAGEALTAWMNAKGIAIPDVPAPKGSLIRREARFFRACPDEAAALWKQYIEDTEKEGAA